jgi:hypothetical protein
MSDSEDAEAEYERLKQQYNNLKKKEKSEESIDEEDAEDAEAEYERLMGRSNLSSEELVEINSNYDDTNVEQDGEEDGIKNY